LILPSNFEIDIENVRNTRYRDHGGAIQ
jgi:hypothetical protein